MYRIAVAGNPNSGKTCLFNELTGATQRVGNYAGVTVEFVEGKTLIGENEAKIIDLPGTYSLTAYSQEEVVARDFIVKEHPDVIIAVLDASNLERNLYLTVQLIELDVPIVIALNMIDVAEKKGQKINAKRLGELLGVEVVPTVAVRKEGIEELKAACARTIELKQKPKSLAYTHELDGALQPLECAIEETKGFKSEYPTRWLALKLLESDSEILERLKAHPECNRTIKDRLDAALKHVRDHSGEDGATAVIESRYAIASGAAKDVVSISEEKKRMMTDVIDSVVCHRVFGPLFLLGVVYFMFKFVFGLADELAWVPLGFNEAGAIDWYSPAGVSEVFFSWLGVLVTNNVEGEMLQSLLRDGIIGGVGGVLGFVPLIFFMFIFISILEDSGYIARIAFILDRFLRIFGMQGKSILALIVSGGLGAGCAVPGIMATRTLREEKDRLVTILVAPFMNCGAKMPVYAMLISAFFAKNQTAMMLLLWALSWVFALCAAFCLRKWVIKGEQTPFVMELPVYHMPTMKGVLMHTWHRTWMYVKKAGTIILAISILLWALMYFPRQDEAPFDKKRDQIVAELGVKTAKTSHAAMFTADKLEETAEAIKKARNAEYKLFAEALKNLEEDSKSVKDPAVLAYAKYKAQMVQVDVDQAQNQLLHSFAGSVGDALEPVSQYAGFDWKLNISLIGGFAAKEVVIGTLGTAYAMGEVDPEEPEDLSTRISKDDDWSPLKAFTVMIFVLIYAPCVVTIAAIKKETGSWKWALFSTGYTTTLGFVVAVIVYQVGKLFVS